MPPVTDPSILGQLNGTSRPSVPARPVYGAPDPNMQFKVEDQAMQREAAAREAERLRIAQEAEARAARKQQIETEDRETGRGATEGERKAAAFLIRALGANKSYEGVDVDPNEAGVQGIGPRSLVGQFVSEKAPDFLNSLPSAVGNSPERQVADTNQDEFIAASLRQDSGAAIPPEELERQRRIYFPMPGDGPEAIAAKREARLRAIEGLKQSSGALLNPTLQRWDEMSRAKPADQQSDFTEEELASGLTGAVSDTTPNDPSGGSDGSPIQTSLDPRFHNPTGAQGLFDLAKQGVTLGLSDEAAGIGGALSTIFTGGDALDAYRRDRDLERENLRQAREAHPIAGTAAEFLGGGAAARIGQGANALANIVRQGAGIGGVGGFGYGEGAQGSTANALIGGAGGAALGYGAGRLGQAISNRRPSPIDVSVVEAGQRQNVPVRQFDARPELRNKASAVETTQHGGPAIREARAADAAAIEGRVAEVGGQGNPADPYALGTKVQAAGKKYIARTRQQADRLYKTAEREAGEAMVSPRNAESVLDANIQELRAAGENSNAAAIKYLEGLKSDVGSGLSLKSVQNLRTNMRGQISQNGLTGTDTERRVSQVVDAMTQDLTEQLPQSASTALRAADDFYKQRQTFINDTLKQFMGSRGNPLPAETAATRLTSMAQGKGNFERFSAMWKELDPTDQADVAATIASSLGRKANGEFSVSTLVRSLDPSKGINPRTARLVFGEDGAQALNDLRILAKAKTDTQAAMNNSRTGATVNQAAGGLKTLLASVLGFGAGGPGGAAAGAVSREFFARWGEQRAAKMLLNPDFTKWLKNAPNTKNPKAIDRYFSRLSGVLAANDNQAFTNALISAARNSPGRAAAEDETQAGREPVQ